MRLLSANSLRKFLKAEGPLLRHDERSMASRRFLFVARHWADGRRSTRIDQGSWCPRMCVKPGDSHPWSSVASDLHNCGMSIDLLPPHEELACQAAPTACLMSDYT